jgi:hypothetical protein
LYLCCHALQEGDKHAKPIAPLTGYLERVLQRFEYHRRGADISIHVTSRLITIISFMEGIEKKTRGLQGRNRLLVADVEGGAANEDETSCLYYIQTADMLLE